ncbi:MAG: DUF4339 domain-containing protein [Opitutales bacterium]
MATVEYYVRNESETEARGPFNLEQLISLVENGQVTVESLFYDATTEQWTAINTNEELKAALFPEKKKLKIKTREEFRSLNAPTSEDTPPITVSDMLAAAEGRTEDTKDKRDPKIAMARAAAIGCWTCVLLLVLSAVSELLPSIDFLTAFSVDKLYEQPLVVLGALDVFFAIMLLLGTVSLYPLVRFRAALGLGFVGFIFYAQGMTLPLVALLAGSFGLYYCTVALTLPSVLAASGVGLAGMLGVAYELIMT